MIVIVNYGLGNARSVQNMIRRIGERSEISGDPEVIGQADKLILPGVGNFEYGMSQLRELGLIDVLNERVLRDGVPALGICLGAQLLGRRSEEGDKDGLNWIPMDTVAFDRSRLSSRDRLPHMGWADTKVDRRCPLFSEGGDDPRFYYVHSYHFQCEEKNMEICHADFGYEFVSGVAKDNILGVQFHPEKSHRYGMELLKNFIERF